MIIFHFEVPGSWLNFHDIETSRELRAVFDHLVSSFISANAALNLFNESCDKHEDESDDPMALWSQGHSRKLELRGSLFESLGEETPLNSSEYSFQVDKAYKLEMWKEGRGSKSLEKSALIIFARAFVYALDEFDRGLEAFTKIPNAPSAASELSGKMKGLFPDLREVRNSAHHMEDRVRGKRNGGRELVPQAIDNNIARSSSGLIIGVSINGTKYGTTMANGHYGEVDISAASMSKLLQMMQDVIACFNWTGRKQHFPKD
ncbi:hypothetical protein CWR53_03490 [Pseudomonas sp. SGAir0191]|uniref:hypothetical protein n=1 Tax=Pseudomonas sp. SGAir0191 TaxID=2217867 RepID=UPI000C2C8108|nr:hypothetical protein [Pseudomonas sp. SGAir0191]AUA31723.1 hypothetical protein CWR53_03490 [Pseudomonas sp. SGAir0191]